MRPLQQKLDSEQALDETWYDFPLETGSRRSSGASSQNGLGHGKEYLGAIGAAETVHRTHGPDVALNQKYFRPDYKCRQCVQRNRLDSIRLWSRQSYRSNAS